MILHSKGSRSSINLFCCHPLFLFSIGICEKKRHILNALFICFLDPSRPAVLLVFLATEEEEHNLSTNFVLHNTLNDRISEELLLSLHHSLILVSAISLSSVVLFNGVSNFQLVCQINIYFIRKVNRKSRIRKCETLRNNVKLTKFHCLNLILTLFHKSRPISNRELRVNLKIYAEVILLKFTLLCDTSPSVDANKFDIICSFDRTHPSNLCGICECTLLINYHIIISFLISDVIR